jgi:glucokinase
VVDFATGRLRSSVNVPFQDVPLRDVLSERLGLPVFVDNDATVAALADAWDGERIAIQNLVMFTVGTGVGGGLVLGGRVYRGATGAAAEIGHTLIGLDLSDGAPAPSPAGPPQPGTLESFAAGSELDRLARAAAERDPESGLGRRAAAGQEISGEDAVELAHEGDPVAVDTVRVLGERLGVGIANAINLLDPDVVAIGGGVSSAGELLLGPAREIARGYVLPGVGTETEIRLARRGPEAGVLGAALLAATEHEQG